MAIERWGFFSVPHPLWHWASVYNGHLREPVTLTLIAEHLAVELSLPVFTTKVCRSLDSNTQPSTCETNANNRPLRHRSASTAWILKLICNYHKKQVLLRNFKIWSQQWKDIYNYFLNTCINVISFAGMSLETSVFKTKKKSLKTFKIALLPNLFKIRLFGRFTCFSLIYCLALNNKYWHFQVHSISHRKPWHKEEFVCMLDTHASMLYT